MALRLDVQIGGDATGFKRTMSGLASTASAPLNGIKNMIAGAFTVGAISSFSRATINWASNIRDMADGLNVSAVWLQKMSNGAAMFGGSMEDVGRVMDQLNRSRQEALQNPEGEKAKAFGRLGISQSDIQNLSPQEFFDRIVAGFKNGTQANVADLEIAGGKSARNLATAFKNQFESDAPVLSESMIDQLDSMGDSMTGLSQILRVEFAPAIIWVGDAIRNVITGIKAYAAALGTYFAEFDLMKIIKANFSIEGLKSGGSIGEMARQLGAASPAAEAAFKKTIQDDADMKVKMEQAAELARLERERKNKESPKFEPLTEPKAKADQLPAQSKVHSDSLLAVGNFLGAGRASGLENIAQKQLLEAKAQTRHLEKIYINTQKPSGTILTP